MLLQVISAIDAFATVGVFLLSNGRFAIVMLECSFIEEESGTLLALVLGSFYGHSLVAPSAVSPHLSHRHVFKFRVD